MGWYRPASAFDKVFEGGIIVKGVSGLLEFIAGLLLLVFKPAQIHQFITFVTQKELLEDPHDKLAAMLVHGTAHISAGGRTFAIIYLWLHATIKLVAVIGILKNQRWAYPFSLITLGLLMLYQVYSIIFVKLSVGMILLTIFDIVILALIWREYSKLRAAKPPLTLEVPTEMTR